ncbi:MAG: outer membrane protein transport protein [Bacteroidaceae bacterium]|nr:outer membrane protein transport protein [Bacteroidaceae bacterium]
MKRFFTTLVLASAAAVTFAGGLLTNTNQSASFVRNPARFASLSTDAIYFNPAGTAFFNDGWSFSANWQMIWQQRDAISIKPTLGGTTPLTETYDGKVYVPCMPTLFAAYKTGDWTFSGFFGMPGGGGKAEFNNGLPMFDNLIGGLGSSLGLPIALQGASQFESTQYLFALQLGAAYRISENLSAYAGVRANYVSNNYLGTIKAVADLRALQMGKMDLMAVNLDMDQSGIAFAPIVGLDYKVGNFNFAAKYEFRAVTNIENDTKKIAIEANKALDQIPDLGMMGLSSAAIEQMAGAGLGSYLGGFADGNTLRADAPATLTLAGSWQALPRLQVMAGWNYYFDKDAKIESLMGGDNMRKLSRNTIEYLCGAEYQVTDKLLLSAGIQFSNFGINDEYTSDLGFINDSFMTGVGGKYSISEKVDFNFGYCYANYAPDHNKLTSTRYERKTHNVSVGVDFRL